MKNYLILILCLVVAGCESMGHHSHRKEGDQAIRRVMDARSDIRQVISHLPRTETELADADQDPGAMIFSVADYVKRLRAISLKDCPEDFQKAFVNYVEAWNARAAANPGLCLRLAGGSGTHEENNPDAARRSESTWQALQEVVTKHVTAKPKDE